MYCMHRTSWIVGLIAGSLLTACSGQRAVEMHSGHPDRVLFDRAVEAMGQKRFDVTNLDLQTLLDTYPTPNMRRRRKPCCKIHELRTAGNLQRLRKSATAQLKPANLADIGQLTLANAPFLALSSAVPCPFSLLDSLRKISHAAGSEELSPSFSRYVFHVHLLLIIG